jgi:hydrogenase maturation protease
MQETLLIGIGNRFRSDDGIGGEIIDRLVKLDLSGVRAVEASGEGAGLIDLWAGYNDVYVFDAVASGAQAGHIFRIDTESDPVPTGFFNYSTHAFSLAEAIELSRNLKSLPPNLVVYGIEGRNFEHGLDISPVVLSAATEVVSLVSKELECTKLH